MLVPKFEGFIMDNDCLMRCNNWIYLPPMMIENFLSYKAHRAVYMAHP
jgi:hypothetical protein